MPEPTESIVELRDGMFKIRVLTAGEGDPVVCLHGGGGLVWDPLIDALASTYRVIAPEHPGAGFSQGLEYVEDLWDLVLYHNELFDALGLESPVLVGHSFGGMVAAEIASTNPDRVSKLVLVAPVGLWDDDHPVVDFSGVPVESLPALLFADPTGPAATSGPAPDPTDLDAMLRASLTVASILQFVWPLPDKGLRKRLYRLKAPTLIVWGTKDALVDVAYADMFKAAIADARVELIEGSGHIPQVENAEQTIAAVTKFLAEA
jgi:pimeloyl-ACP methyl ester carboxylesterase